MQAAVLYRPHELKFEEVDLPQLKLDEVLVKVMACGVCGSDVHAYEGRHFRVTYPRILGHEFSGVVVRWRGDVTGLKEGDRVCAETNVPCGECDLCLEGNPHLCKDIEVIGFNRDGGYAEYVAVPAINLIPLPAHLSFEHATIAQPLGVGYHAVIDRADIKPGQTVVVLGAGPVGLGVITMARVLGARTVAVEIQPHRISIAERRGADEVIDAARENVVDRVMKLTDNKGADWVMEAAGGDQEETVSLATQLVKPKGSIVIVGTFPRPIPVRMSDLRSKELDIRGTRGQYRTYSKCIDLVASGKVDLMNMLSAKLPLRDAQKGLEMMSGKREPVIKVLLVADQLL